MVWAVRYYFVLIVVLAIAYEAGWLAYPIPLMLGIGGWIVVWITSAAERWR